MRHIAFTICVSLSSSYVLAENDNALASAGWSGAIGLGLGSQNTAANLYRDNKSKSINTLNAPAAYSGMQVLPIFDLRYTLEGGKTQFVLGSDTDMENPLGMDSSMQLGLRHQIARKGIVSANLLLGGLGENTWTDPYITGVDREGTRRKTSGLRLSWDQLMDTGFGASLTYRKISLGTERSGAGISGLSTADRLLLDRNGYSTKLQLSYTWAFLPEHQLKSTLVLGKDKLDGSAMSYKSLGLKLDYAYNISQYDQLAVNLYLGQQRFDKESPLFNKRKADSRDYLLGASYERHQLFGYKPLTGFISASYGKSRSDIDFYSITVKSVGLGAAYNF